MALSLKGAGAGVKRLVALATTMFVPTLIPSVFAVLTRTWIMLTLICVWLVPLNGPLTSLNVTYPMPGRVIFVLGAGVTAIGTPATTSPTSSEPFSALNAPAVVAELFVPP